MLLAAILFLAVCFLAYANGANDNFKGVATLFGSKTTGYKPALAWATLSTLAGSAASIVLARSLIKTFSGESLVPAFVAATPEFLLAVALGAGLTVMLATVTGFPISTTHGLTGALVGAGFMAVGSRVDLGVLGGRFFLPLLLSPFLALVSAAAVYAALRLARLKMGIGKQWCLCVGETVRVLPIPQAAATLSLSALRTVEPALDTEANCVQRYTGSFVGVRCQTLLDCAHYASAGMVCFARGLNDTPKIVALLLGVQALGLRWGMAAVACLMAVGGVFNARKVAEKMSEKITPLNSGQGFSANLVTAVLVLFASRFGVPVSTTHVSVGSLFGIGTITGRADVGVVRAVLLSWLLTLPAAALLGAAAYFVVANT